MKYKQFKEYILSEMAKNIDPTFSMLNFKNKSSEYYSYSKDFKIFKKVNSDIFVVEENKENKTIFYTNSSKLEKTLHLCSISHNVDLDDNVNIKCDVQNTVDRIKDNTILPKGYATDFIYNYFKHSKLPLRSSSEQYTNGKNLWERLIIKSLSDNIFTYFYSKENLIEIKEENLNMYLNLYFGSSNEHKHKHLIISKDKLKWNI